MYSKDEASKIRQQFWIAFGKYMKPIPSAEGLTINWANYKTGVKHLFFKMNAEQRFTIISIDITHPDQGTRQLFFEQFKAFKTLLNEALGEDWIWQKEISDDFGVPLARISKIIDGVSIYNQQSWPASISFLKPRIIALDEFWTNVKPIFESIS
jgi:hypothetical protein